MVENPSQPAGQSISFESTKPKHVHTWVNVTKVIHHNEEGHFEKRQTETEIVFDEDLWDICKEPGQKTRSRDH